MKDKNGIEIKCENCLNKMLLVNTPGDCALCPNLEFVPSPEAYKARIAELQTENALLKDGESHIMDVKMSPKFVKSIIRTVNSEIKILKRKLRFTDKELNIIRNTFQDQIREDKNGWSAEKKIVAKCNELLKERKD